MQQITQVPTETQAPATLDGVSIQDCQFTESVGKREPRPPLRSVAYRDGTLSGDIALSLRGLGGGWVYVKIVDWTNPTEGLPTKYNHIYSGRADAKCQPYTGPITPAMWARIRKYWKP